MSIAKKESIFKARKANFGKGANCMMVVVVQEEEGADGYKLQMKMEGAVGDERQKMVVEEEEEDGRQRTAKDGVGGGW